MDAHGAKTMGKLSEKVRIIGAEWPGSANGK